MSTIPDKLPTAFLDRALFALRPCGEMVLRMELAFGHGLDADRLARAVELAMDAEPVLGCRLDTEPKYGEWVRLPPSARPGLVAVDGKERYEQEKVRELDPEEGPLLSVCLLRRSEGDLLLIKVAHEVADAGALKRISLLLADLYARLEEDPGYSPTPNLDGSRSLDQLTGQIPWTARPAILASFVREALLQNASGPCLTVPLEQEDELEPAYLRRTLPEEPAQEAADFAKRHEATLNDLFSAAFLRAMARVADWQQDRMLGLAMTTDLRRYLPDGDTGGICNMSFVEGLSLGRRLEPELGDTLRRVSDILGSRKKRWIGLGLYGSPMAGPLRRMPLQKYRDVLWDRWETMRRKGKLPPVLTNMGVIPTIAFGGQALEAHLLVPSTYPPGVSFGLSGYQGTLTLSTVAYPKSRSAMEQVLDETLAELPLAGS